MKKIISMILVLMFAFASTSVFAQDITVKVNGEAVEFDRNPAQDNGVVMIPLRAVAEKMGANVNWYADTQTVFTDFGGQIATIQIGNDMLFLNGDSYKMEMAPYIDVDRTLVPLILFEKSTEYKVDFDSTTNTVNFIK